MKTSILCVDDEKDNLEALERIFRTDFNVLKANSGDEALKVLSKNPDVALILSDQRMPEMTGSEFLKRSIKTHPETIRMLLTGYTDIDSVIEAINSGEIYKYLTKPWDPVDLENTVKKGVERYLLNSELHNKNKQLTQALEELKTLDHSKTNLMLLINHELKTPLTVISSFLELLKESKLDDEQTLFTKKIESSSDKLKKLVNDVLELLKADLGQVKTDIKKMDTDKIFLMLKKSLPKDLTLESDGKTKHEAKSDAQIINKVLIELCYNALKFSSDKKAIFIASEGASKELITVGIKSSGPEIKPDMIKKILSPFTLDEDALNHSTGTGLGLSICQALLKNIGSQLDIKSEKGITTVSFDIKKSQSA